MGLDTTAYRGLTRVEAVECTGEEGCPCPDCADNVCGFFPSPAFPGREGSLAPGYYRYEEELDIWSSSYSGHGTARARLAELAGYVADRLAWSVPATGPFVEFVNFSDCEGVLGPEVCAKLAEDFQDYRQSAMEIGGEFYMWYEAYRKGFEFAANNGAVHFH